RSASRASPRPSAGGGSRPRRLSPGGDTVSGSAPAPRAAGGRAASARPPPLATLFLIRHGLTAQTGRVLYGQAPGIGLDERGRAQAEQLAARLVRVRLTAIYSSPLERCLETVAPLAARVRLPVVPRDALI